MEVSPASLFCFLYGSCAEGVRFPASGQIPIYLKILQSPGAQKAGSPVPSLLLAVRGGAACKCSELPRLEPFSSAAASCACEQCCCVTHMQLPEMLCNGRWQEGELSSSEPARQRAQPPCCSGGRGRRGVPRSAHSSRIGGDLPGGEGCARLSPPTTTAIGEPWAGP